MSAPKTEFTRIAEALERLVTITEKLVDTLSASPAPVVPSVVKPPPSQTTLSPGEDKLLDDALADYAKHVRKLIGTDGRPWYATHYEKGDAARARWIAINDVMQAHGYLWVSDKEHSHWEPKEAAAK